MNFFQVLDGLDISFTLIFVLISRKEFKENFGIDYPTLEVRKNYTTLKRVFPVKIFFIKPNFFHSNFRKDHPGI